MFTELENPMHLDFTDNKFTDESLPAFVKYIFANEDCRLNFLSLENNLFTSYGKRTLVKAFSLSNNKMNFKCGPLPFNEAAIKHAFNIQYDIKSVINKNTGNVETQKVIKSMSREKLELIITRKPVFNYKYQQFMRNPPSTRSDREVLQKSLIKIQQTLVDRYNITIEDLRDLLIELTSLNFDFPRHKLEPLFDVINEKLF